MVIIIKSKMSTVLKISDTKNLRRLMEESKISKKISRNDLIAVKLHMGEKFNHKFIKPLWVKEIVNFLKEQESRPFLTDTTTLYRGNRFTALGYLETARVNGFNFDKDVPIIIADGLKGEHGIKSGDTEIAQAIYEADFLLVITHCTGHISTGYGGSIKNVGMGCVTKNGKRKIHRHSMPSVDREKCIKCGTCQKNCPYNVITLNEFPEFDAMWCVGCGRCLVVCPEGALYREGEWFENYIKALVESANSVIKKFRGKIYFINFLTNITADCDCAPQKENLIPDIGVLASNDIVSIDAASYDLIEETAGRDILREKWDLNGRLQFKIAEEMEMGSSRYEMEEV